jgi:hypothetical protein
MKQLYLFSKTIHRLFYAIVLVTRNIRKRSIAASSLMNASNIGPWRVASRQLLSKRLPENIHEEDMPTTPFYPWMSYRTTRGRIALDVVVGDLGASFLLEYAEQDDWPIFCIVDHKRRVVNLEGTGLVDEHLALLRSDDTVKDFIEQGAWICDSW